MLETAAHLPHEAEGLDLHHHESVTELHLCHDDYLMCKYVAEVEYAAELAVERAYEDRGFWAAREDEEREMAGGSLGLLHV